MSLTIELVYCLVFKMRLYLVSLQVEFSDVNSTFTRAGLTIIRGINFVHIVAPGEVDVLADIVHATFGKRGSLKDYVIVNEFLPILFKRICTAIRAWCA